MSYEKTKLMNLEDGQTLLGAIDEKMSDLKSAVDQTKADVITVADTESSAIKTFPDGADDQPMAVRIAIEPVQSGEGDPSPTNVRPISGWTGANVLVRGKNLIPNGIELANYIKGLFVYSQIDTTNKTVSFNPKSAEGYPFLLYGTKDANGRWYPYKTNTPYTFIFKVNSSSSSGKINMGVSYTDGTNNGGFGMDQVVDGYIVWTSPSNKTVKSFYAGIYGGTTTLWYDEIGVFEGTVTLEDFVPYAGKQYSITFPTEAGTVYGGTLTVNKDGTGRLVVDRACVSITSSTTRDGLRINNNNVCAANYALTRFGISVDGDRSKDILSNALDIYTPSNIYNFGTPNTCGLSNNSQHIYVMSTKSITNAEEFEAWMDSIGTVQVCFYLAEETVIPLTNIEVIETLKGLNNLWADTGDILSVDYPADTKLYVDGQIADKISASQRMMELIITTNREDGMKATKAYSQGNLMIVNGQLYKATTSIANGATLTVDTNITATTVAAELAALA